LVKNIRNALGNLFGNVFSGRAQTQFIQPSSVAGVSQAKNQTWDSVSNERIKQLDSRIQQPAINFINETESQLNTKLRITQGYRSFEEQDKLYNQSRTTPPTGPWVTNAKGGQSYHNYGLAIDVVVMDNNKPNWNKPISKDIANIASTQGFEWGGNWKPPATDYPHFQVTFGETWQSLLKKVKK
jgi:LAS superfamily LD-carboxypeptidase LdcB